MTPCKPVVRVPVTQTGRRTQNSLPGFKIGLENRQDNPPVKDVQGAAANEGNEDKSQEFSHLATSCKLILPPARVLYAARRRYNLVKQDK
ncbi:hypothetical protein hamaS1_06770 [Moorella sp. Hama-1]|nr:hypothetical protein hamaS1_06770 [Moorella sp. Hama-1]